jgi:hypothetical protein
VDLFDPGSGSQVHDLNAGILPNGLFWTAQLPSDAFQVSPDGQVASLALRAQPLVDNFTLFGPLAIAAQVDIDLLWQATGAPIDRGQGAEADPTSPAAFIGHFAEARCTGTVRGFETGFSFTAGELTSADFFAELGPERNGVFLQGPPASLP